MTSTMTSITFLAEEIVSFLDLWPDLMVQTRYITAVDSIICILIWGDAFSPLVRTHGLYGQTGGRVGRSLPMLKAKHGWTDKYREVFVRATSGIPVDRWTSDGLYGCDEDGLFGCDPFVAPMNYHIKAAFTLNIVQDLEEKHRDWCRRLVDMKRRDDRNFITRRSLCRQEGPYGLHWQRHNVQTIKELRNYSDEQVLSDKFAQDIRTWRRVIDDVMRDVAKFLWECAGLNVPHYINIIHSQ